MTRFMNQQFVRSIQRTVALGLAVGASVFGFAPLSFAGEASSATISDLTARQSMPDGVYLYGQAEVANQLGSAYMVFEVQDQRVLGAFYMPHSSFDCFSGEFQGEALALNVVDSYEQTVHPYTLALAASAEVASTGGQVVTVGIEGFHPLVALSDMDQSILNTCRTDLGTL